MTAPELALLETIEQFNQGRVIPAVNSREAGTRIPEEERPLLMQQFAAHYRSGSTVDNIADIMGLTEQQAWTMNKQCIQAGMYVPRRAGKRKGHRSR
jgi:hypothetical protein